VGGEEKTPGRPCGVCTPCIVRRTAWPSEVPASENWEGYAYDLTKLSVQRHEKLGMTFRAYLELIAIVLGTSDDDALIEELAPEARAWIGGAAGPTRDQAASLLRRFTTEFCEAFDIADGNRS